MTIMRIAFGVFVVMLIAGTGYFVYPKEPEYYNRTIVQEGHGFGALKRAPLSAGILRSHSQISDRVLLVRSTNVVNDVNRFGAPKVLKRALHQGGVTDSAIDSAIQGWIASLDEPPKGLLQAVWQSCASPAPNCLNT